MSRRSLWIAACAALGLMTAASAGNAFSKDGTTFTAGRGLIGNKNIADFSAQVDGRLPAADAAASLMAPGTFAVAPPALKRAGPIETGPVSFSFEGSTSVLGADDLARKAAP